MTPLSHSRKKEEQCSCEPRSQTWLNITPIAPLAGANLHTVSRALQAERGRWKISLSKSLGQEETEYVDGKWGSEKKNLFACIYLQQIKTNMQASPWNYWEEKGTLFFLSNIPATTNLKCAKCQSCCLFIDISFRINVIIKRLFIYFPHSESYFSTRSHTLQKQIFLSPHQNLVIVQPGEKYFQAPQLGWMS